ncbi:MAG: type IV pilus twitching motility protein PilT [Candidatus Velthaea sp.]
MSDIGAVALEELVRNARERSASDVHFGGGDRSAMRVDGRLLLLPDTPPPAAAVARFVESKLTPAALARLSERGTADAAYHDVASGACRIHVYRHVAGLRVVVRLLANALPDLENLGLPPFVATLANQRNGLVLFTGPTGSGKTTALAALIDRINRTSESHILTIEDPVEYLHTPIRSLITHCEVGRDVSDYAEALRAAVRSDPDVILVGEMRDRETIGAAMTAAETGHLVFATLHTNDAPQTVDRIVDAFPSETQAQMRSQLSNVLVAVVSLRLVRRRSGTGRRAVAEILVGTDAVRNMIRDGKTHQLRNAIVTGRGAGMQTLETHLSELVVRAEIGLETARAMTSRPAEVQAFEQRAAV